MSVSTNSEECSERVESTGQAALDGQIEYFQYNPQLDITYERWVQMTMQRLFHSVGKSPSEKFELLAKKCISWDALDQGLAVNLCQILYNEYEKTFEALERKKEKEKGLVDKINEYEDAKTRVARLFQGYQECVSSTTSQLSDAAQLGTVIHNVIRNIHSQILEIGRVLHEMGAGEVPPAAPLDPAADVMAPSAPAHDNNDVPMHQMQDEINRYAPEPVCEMIVHDVAVGNGTLYLLLLDTPFGRLLDKHGVPCETGLYVLHKNLTKCLQGMLPARLALKDVSQWLGTSDSFTLEASCLDTIRFGSLREDATRMAEECKRVAQYRANNGIAFIYLEALGTIVDGLKAKVGSSRARDRQQCVDALDDFYEHVKGEAACLHEQLRHIQEEESAN